MITSLGAFGEGAPWPIPEEKERRAKWANYKQLFKGQHDQVYGNAIEVVHPGLNDSKVIILNFNKRLTTHWADMLVGEPPVITANNASDSLSELLKENALTSTVTYEVAVDTSRYGVGVYKVSLQDGAAKVEAQQPEFWYPVVTPNNIREVKAHVIAYTFKGKRPGESWLASKDVDYIYIETHTKGAITYRVHRLSGGVIRNPVDPRDYIDIPKGAVEVDNLGYTVQTNVDDFLIIPVTNLRATGEVYGHSDYDDLDGLMKEAMLRLSEISKILSQHSQPSAYGPQSAIQMNQRTGRWEFKKQGYFVIDRNDATPGYLTWDGKLDANFTMFTETLNQIYLIAETSPAAFGQLKSGLAESGSALKRLLMSDLAKVARIRNNFDPAIKRVIRVANMFERNNGSNVTAIDDVSVDWRDGLPDDPTETSQNVEREVIAGVRSKYSAVKMLHPDWSEEQVQEELGRIANDMAGNAAFSPGSMMPRSITGTGDANIALLSGTPPDDA